jgi:hypothetical protein
MMQNSGPGRQLGPRREPGAQLLPAPLVHADLAPPAALAAADQDRASPLVEIVLGERERSWRRTPARHSTTMIARRRQP